MMVAAVEGAFRVVADRASTFGNTSLVLIAGLIILVSTYLLLRSIGSGGSGKGEKVPPMVPYTIPFIGSVVDFGQSPIDFLEAQYKKYGPVFSFKMFGQTCTYLVGSETAGLFFNSKNDDLNAEDVYAGLTVPVFGKGVAYDVPHSVFSEQKRMIKTGLNGVRLRAYVPLIEEETRAYFARWGDSGEKDLFHALSEVIIMTASRCLHGKEVRSMLDESVAELYKDLDGGFTPAAWFLPSWLPLPSFRRRDKAHIELKKVFSEVIRKRRQAGGFEEDQDMLRVFMEESYKDGRPLNDDEIAGMLIALLLAGQHTSSTTSSWIGLFLALKTDLQKECADEAFRVVGDLDAHVDFDQLAELEHLDRVLKETLRLRPPIMTMMRMVRTPQHVGGYTVPTGHQICISPTVNQRLEEVWTDRMEFRPSRFAEETDDLKNNKFAYVPFGAGRHKCIGEYFAYMQIKTIWATLFRMFEFELPDGKLPDIDYTTMIHVPKTSIVRYKRRTAH